MESLDIIAMNAVSVFFLTTNYLYIDVQVSYAWNRHTSTFVAVIGRFHAAFVSLHIIIDAVITLWNITLPSLRASSLRVISNSSVFCAPNDIDYAS